MPATALTITHHQMRAAISAGKSRPMCDDIPELRQYNGRWWISSPEGWLQITNAEVSAEFDEIATRLGRLSAETPRLRTADVRQPDYRADLL